MNARSALPEVRNPLLALPEARELLAMPECPHCRFRARFYGLLRAIVVKSRADAQKSWAQNKGPMALYWKCVGVYAYHVARLFR